MQQIFSNTTLTVNQLIEKIDTGELGLPELQRPFIWKDSKVRDLFDSMMCGYPIGYLMLWECPTSTLPLLVLRVSQYQAEAIMRGMPM